jgi:hypothetical protein
MGIWIFQGTVPGWRGDRDHGPAVCGLIPLAEERGKVRLFRKHLSRSDEALGIRPPGEMARELQGRYGIEPSGAARPYAGPPGGSEELLISLRFSGHAPLPESLMIKDGKLQSEEAPQSLKCHFERWRETSRLARHYGHGGASEWAFGRLLVVSGRSLLH